MLGRDSIVTLLDPLSFGPLSAIEDLAQWFAMRKAFWKSMEPAARDRNQRRRRERYWRKEKSILGMERIVDADEVVLWVGAGVDDQVILAWLPQLLRAVGVDVGRMRVVQFERRGNGGLIECLGELPVEELAGHPPARGLSAVELHYLDDAWNALIAPEPDLLLRFVERDVVPLPLLAGAMQKLLGRYPDWDSGVNFHERILLRAVREVGPRAAGVVGDTMKCCHGSGDRAGDRWLFSRLLQMGRSGLPTPAVEIIGAGTEMRNTEFRLTLEGELVERGELNFARINGIDDWVGGVHLDSGVGKVWFRRGGTLVRG